MVPLLDAPFKVNIAVHPYIGSPSAYNFARDIYLQSQPRVKQDVSIPAFHHTLTGPKIHLDGMMFPQCFNLDSQFNHCVRKADAGLPVVVFLDYPSFLRWSFFWLIFCRLSFS